MKQTVAILSSSIRNFTELFTHKQQRTFYILYLLLIISLFLYSFTQIDLGLTITRVQSLFVIQRAFQYIGYFNRSLSTLLFVVLLVLLYLFYILFSRKASQKNISWEQLTGVLVFIIPFLIFSYTAFSYDLFNYIFDAKIFTFYHQNPYLHKALDFPGDPMLGFMHWTHRVYPYGPVWLGLTIPLSFLGLHYFIPTLVLFKLSSAAAFIFCILGMKKILEKVNPSAVLKGVIFFALSPLVLIEGLMSAHNDLVMIAFALWAIYFLISKKYFWAFALLFLSIGVKFATVFILPIFVVVYLLDKQKKKISWELCLVACFIAMLGAVAAVSYRTTFQPWYLLNCLPFAALLPQKKYLTVPVIILSVIALLNYVPYLYLGNWNDPVPQILNTINLSALCVASVYGVIIYLKDRRA